jgi:hypothetical protein
VTRAVVYGRMPAARLLVLAISCAAGAACVDRGPGDPGDRLDPEARRANLLDTPPPTIGRRSGARLKTPGGGEVVYLGADLDPGAPVAPGGTVSIVHYWHVVTPPGDGWRVFTHVRGDGGDFVNADHSEVRRGHPVGRWRAGQVIRDPQSFVIDPDWRTPTATIAVGLFQTARRRIEDRAEIAGGEVVDRALVVATLDVDLDKAPPPPGTVIVPKATGPIVIDGIADEPAWLGARHNSSFHVVEGGGCTDNSADNTQARLTWDDQYLYVFVASEDADVYSPYTARDDTLWKHDVVEIFIDADRNRRGYVELQVSPRNVHFDTWFATTRSGVRDDSFDAEMISQVVTKGTLDNRDDGDVGWDVEVAIPHAAVRGNAATMDVRIPPSPGDTWRLNIVRVDVRRDDAIAAQSWGRFPCGDFHALDRMITVQFADEQGGIVPAAPPAPEAAPASAPAP